MKKIFKNFLVIFFIVFFVCLSYLPTNKALAATLEVQYPTLQDGTTVTPQSDLTQYLKYIFDLGIFIGFFAVFLSLVYAGILYFLSPAIPDALEKAKDRISGAISGLLILVLLYLIITTINPYLAIFRLNALDDIPVVQPTTQSFGVNFYSSQNCSGIANTNITSVPDLGDLKNKINSVGIAQNPQQDLYYIAILYDITNYWGKCQYINPNTNCSPIQPFTASASIYQYDFHPSGGGVYLYRKSFNQIPGKEDNKKGSFLKITNSQIANSGGPNIYTADLNQLRFTGNSSNYNNLEDCTVPKEEQDCAKYDVSGKCIQKQCPNLSGENISSIEIAGDYLVLLIYFNPSDNTYGPWSYCQAYSSLRDVNKDGPQQIKWDAIKNRGQDPNFIMIIPVVEK